MIALLRRPLIAALVLTGVYVALSFANDGHGSLGSDTGAKVATLKVMKHEHRVSPDVGYWAERWDRDGSLHPLYRTAHIKGHWVQVTTLPMLYAAYPLYRLGGYRLALLLPMAGAVAAALAGRALARRLGDGDGMLAFWIVGLASPIAIYALDFWEHSIGVALLAWAVVLLVDVARGERLWRAPVAGVLIGVAAALRTEALVYGGVATAVMGLALLLARRRARAFVAGACVAAGLATMVVGNAALETATVGSTLRVGRATGAVVQTAEATGHSRVDEAIITLASPIASVTRGAEAAALALLVALLAFAILTAKRREAGFPARAAGAGVAALFVGRLAGGLDFVPGLVAAAPLAAVGLVHGWSTRPGRIAVGAVTAALPLVWAFQFQGGAGPQWGGRYILTTGLVLTVAGVVALPLLVRWARIEVVALSVAVTVLGLAWLSVRSHSVADAAQALDRRPEPVVVSRVAYLAREVGATYGDKRWLTAVTDADFKEAMTVLRRAGVDRFAEVRIMPPTGPGSGATAVRFFPGLYLSVRSVAVS
ncbi:MAG TPA: hypothetical protein VFB78_00230 [Acidimicrobiales bacterium]|nr:hypothetical protein [Acidimicrobiales bacterium]